MKSLASSPAPKKILVVNPFGIGDVIFSLRAIEVLRKKHPQALIGFLCNERACELVRLDASVARIHLFNRDHLRRIGRGSLRELLKEVLSFFREIKKENYDWMIDYSLGREFSFLGWFAGIRVRLGFDYKGRGIFLTHRKKIAGYQGRPVSEIQAELLKEAGILEDVSQDAKLPLKISPESEEKVGGLLMIAGVGPGERIAVLAPGGGKSWGEQAIYKQWDPDRFALIAKTLRSEDGYRIVLLGDEPERKLLQEVFEKSGRSAALFCGDPIEDVCALLRRAHILIGNDGGLTHLANAAGTRTVSIFGPVDERVYAPSGSGVEKRVVFESVPCRPCYQNFHFPPCRHQRRCLTELGEEKVLRAVRELS